MSQDAEEQAKTILHDMYARRLANQENIKRWYHEERANKTVEALRKNGFTAFYVEERQKARQEILKLIPDGATVGVGGSITIRQLEVLPELAKKGTAFMTTGCPGSALKKFWLYGVLSSPVMFSSPALML